MYDLKIPVPSQCGDSRQNWDGFGQYPLNGFICHLYLGRALHGYIIDWLVEGSVIMTKYEWLYTYDL